MTDRDRLAADLTAACGRQLAATMADRLIALGWTRLDEERLAEAVFRVGIDPNAGHALIPTVGNDVMGAVTAKQIAVAILAAMPHGWRSHVTLDEKRLARPFAGGNHLQMYDHRQNRWLTADEAATAIAKAYREDTDAD